MKLRIFIEPQEGASYEQQLRVAQAAESLGFDAFFRSDHYLAMSGGLPGPTDSWVTLGALARETSRVRLGTLVTPVTFRSPGVLAISVAQVDQMTTRHRHRSLADAGRRALRLHRADAIGRNPAELRVFGLGGTPNELVERIGEFADLGASTVYLQLLDLDDLDQLALLADAVLPQIE